jgi:hypothetical protein
VSIPAAKRAEVVDATQRHVARPTVLAAFRDVVVWAAGNGLELDDRNRQTLVDAYLAAHYKDEIEGEH